MSDPEIDLLTPAQVAGLLGVKPATLTQWRWRRHGPPFVRVGRSVRYRRTDLQDWIDKGGKLHD